MDYSKYRQHPKFGIVIIQMRGLQNNEVSVLKLNGESLRAKEEDLTPVDVRWKRINYISSGFGVYIPNTIDDVSLKAIVIKFLQIEVITGDEHVVKQALKIAEQLEVKEELNDFICNF